MWLLLVLGVVVVLFLAYYRFMTAQHGTFKKMNIEHPTPSWFTGNFGQALKEGIFVMQTNLYNQYKDKKVYGVYDARLPILFVADLDMMKEIMIKHFNNFVDRRIVIEIEFPFSENILMLTGNRWKHVRSVISPTFSSGRIKRMTPLVQNNSQRLVDVLRLKAESNEPVELKEIFTRFTLDVIASTGFGLDVNTLENPKNEFAAQAKKIIREMPKFIILTFFAPFFLKLLRNLGFSVLSKESMKYLSKTIDSAMVDRKKDGQAGQVNDFMDLLINAEKETGADNRVLTRNEIHGQVLVFILAGFDTVSTALSFTLFLLTNHPEILHKVQAELKDKLGQADLDYDNIQTLTYLDMVINESIRMFPPAYILDRKCTEDITLHGINIPQGMIVSFPVYAIHHDPNIWPDPEKFLPERFSPENKEARHPYAFIPFGYGPRSCIGMRLALLELKLCLANILRSFTPVPCDKTVYPIKLTKLQLLAEDGLWVKFEVRKS